MDGTELELWELWEQEYRSKAAASQAADNPPQRCMVVDPSEYLYLLD